MNITNDAGSLDSGKFLEYIKKNLSSDVAQLVATKDELAKRQGALSAVEATIKAKDAADAYALSKKVDADAILEKAKEAKATAEALVAELKNNGAELEARIAVNDAELAQREKDVATREKKVQANANELDVRFGELKAENDKLDAATAALDARIKAFQDSIKNI
jgi:chromosome segregation ATPase